MLAHKLEMQMKTLFSLKNSARMGINMYTFICEDSPNGIFSGIYDAWDFKVNQNKNSGIFLKKGYLTEITYYLSKKDLTSLGYDFIVQNLLDKFFHVFRKFAENKNIEIKSKDKIMVKLGAAALEAILTFPKTCV